MSNSIIEKAHGIGLSNEVRLGMAHYDSYYSCYDMACESGKRFFQAASLLPEGGYLGWQLSFAAGGDHINHCFAGSAGGVNDDDYNWIFQKCAAVGPDAAGLLTDLFDGKRTVYILEDTDKDCKFPARYEPEPEHCADLYEMLNKNGGVIRIIADGTSAKTARGSVFLSLPQDISLSARTILARCFKNTQAKELV